MIFLYIIMICLCVISAITYRIRGMDGETLPKFLEPRIIRRILCLLVLSTACILTGAYIPAFESEILNYTFTVLAISILAFYGLIAGHGSYFPRIGPNEDNESLSFITRKLSNPLNSWTRFIGMALTGLLITVPVSLIPGIPLWYGLFGLMKPIGYQIGWMLRNKFPEFTVIGEYFWGFFMIAGLIVGFYI